MSTTYTTTTSIYHTPSSSIFDVYHSARASPEPFPSSSSSLLSVSPIKRARRLTTRSDASSSSAATITPSRFARQRTTSDTGSISASASGSASISLYSNVTPSENGFANGTANHTPNMNKVSSSLPPLSLRGARLFTTSAKTGEGVKDVFDYIVKRVVRASEYQEALEARKLHMREASAAETIRLISGPWGNNRRSQGDSAGCCG